MNLILFPPPNSVISQRDLFNTRVVNKQWLNNTKQIYTFFEHNSPLVPYQFL